MARTRCQQVKVSEHDRDLIVALAQLDGMTPSTWCYQAIMEAVATQRDRLKNPNLRLVRAPDREDPPAASAPEPARTAAVSEA